MKLEKALEIAIRDLEVNIYTGAPVRANERSRAVECLRRLLLERANTRKVDVKK